MGHIHTLVLTREWIAMLVAPMHKFGTQPIRSTKMTCHVTSSACSLFSLAAILYTSSAAEYRKSLAEFQRIALKFDSIFVRICF